MIEAPIEAFWAEWEQESDHSEDKLRLYTLSVVEAVKRAAQDGDWPAVGRLERLYAAGASFCQEEPLRSTYETGDFHICLTIADGCFLAHDLKRTWDLAYGIMQSLDSADMRRSKLGMPSRPNSELRVVCLGLLACCFFEDSNFCTLDVMRGVVRRFWQVADKFQMNLAADHVRPEFRESMLHHIGIWELKICKCCLRLGNEFAARSIRAFNERNGEHLFPGYRHFKSGMNETSTSAWYWDYELAKLILEPDSDPLEKQVCEQNRLAYARLTFGGSSLKMLMKSWEASSSA